MSIHRLGFLCATSLIGCGDSSTGTDAAGGDAAAADAGDRDAGDRDAGDRDAGDRDAGSSPTRIYFTLVSHNEDTNTGGNPDCVAFVDAIDERYASNRAAMLEIADIVIGRGAAWDFQTDIQYLQLMLERESAADNVVRELADVSPEHVVVDAHAHETAFKNYADIANLLETASGQRNGVIGGFTAQACNGGSPQPEWEKFWEPLEPVSAAGGPALIATLLTDGASAGHRCDPSVSGVWRPRSHEEFFVDDPASNLPTIGTGMGALGFEGALTGLSELLDDLHAGALEEGRMYTASVTIAHCNFDLADSGSSTAEVAAFIDAVNALGQDDVVWATFPRVAEIWHTQYGSAPSIWPGD
jgi:hypothetical protein